MDRRRLPEDPSRHGRGALAWRTTNAPEASSRTDDIWFLDPTRGWAVNSDGQILKTTDGFRTFVEQHSAPGRLSALRRALPTPTVGWVGTLTPAHRLFHTADGGATWAEVTDLPANAPVAVCGISVVNDRCRLRLRHQRPDRPAAHDEDHRRRPDWTAWDMSAHASILIDTYFTDADHGWVVGGKASGAQPDDPRPDQAGRARDRRTAATPGPTGSPGRRRSFRSANGAGRSSSSTATSASSRWRTSRTAPS